MGRRRIDIEHYRDAFIGQLPRGQTRTLQPGPGFVGVDLFDHAFEPGTPDHPQRRAKSARRQRTGIAVGQHGLGIALMAANHINTQLGHGQVGFTVTFMDGYRLSFKHL